MSHGKRKVAMTRVFVIKKRNTIYGHKSVKNMHINIFTFFF